MNKKTSILVSVAIAASMLATSMSAFAYTDISADHWAKSYVDNLSGKKYVSGYEDGTYKPDNYVTRAEFAKILTNIFGVIDKNGVELTDVADSAWYADTMKIAVKAGYVTGYADGTVKPEANITRQEAAVMVYRAWGLSPEGTLNFTDKAEIADWAANQVATLAAKNVLNGYSDGSFKPNNNITRAEVAKIISCAIALGVNKNNTTTVPTGTTSGMLHVGGTTTHASSNGGGGGSSSSGGNSSTGNKTPAKDPAVEKGTVDEAPEVALNETTVKAVADALDADTTVAADELVVLQLDVDSSFADNITVSFLNPKTDKTEELTVKKFNELMKKLENTKEDVKKIIASITTKISDKIQEDVTIGVSVEKPTGEPVVDKQETSVEPTNYIILSLKDYQSGKDDNYDFAVVMNSYKSGYNQNKKDADAWLKANAKKLKLYSEVLEDLSVVFVNEDITEDNYTRFVDLFNKMTTVIDNAVNYAVEKRGSLTKTQALEYFNTTVTEAIRDSVEAPYTEDVIAVAKTFGADLASKLGTVNKAIQSTSKAADKVELVWDVYNGSYK